MTGPVRHDAIEDLLGAYALDAVESEERALVEEHLATCPKCRGEVEAHREVAGLLSHPGASAPEGLWERIAASLEEPPPPLRVAVLPAGAEREDRTRRRRPRFPGVLAAAAAIVALALIGTVAFLGSDDDAPTLEQLASQALDDPDSQVVELRAPEGRAVSARAVITPDGQGYLLGDDLPALDGQIYQLWGVTRSQAISLGDMGSDPDVRSFSVGEGIDLLAITIEDGAVEQSDNEPAFVGEFS